MPLPNFFIAGAPKAGTTSLYHYLSQHPEIFMSPIKEPSYFSAEVRPENFDPAYREYATREEEASRRYVHGPMTRKRFSGIIRNWDDYQRLFTHANGHTALGEASVVYLWSPTAAAAIAARIPKARIIIILRDPADRAYSQYLHNVSDGHVNHSFRQHVEASLSYPGERFSLHYPFLELGLYADQIQRYLDAFPRRQVRIWLYEDTRNAHQFLTEVLNFLGVDSTVTLDDSTRHLQPQVPRLKTISQPLRRNGVFTALNTLTPIPLRPLARRIAYRNSSSMKISPADRKFLIDYYRHDISKLANRIGRDLSNWLW